MLATVKKLGGSVAIVIPKAMAAENQLAPGTAVDLSQDGDGIMIRKSRRRVRRPINDMVREIDPAAYEGLRREMALDRPVGKEVW
jgi:antitoxin component of MazEF toxin-antitoxin module